MITRTACHTLRPSSLSKEFATLPDVCNSVSSSNVADVSFRPIQFVRPLVGATQNIVHASVTRKSGRACPSVFRHLLRRSLHRRSRQMNLFYVKRSAQHAFSNTQARAVHRYLLVSIRTLAIIAHEHIARFSPAVDAGKRSTMSC